jgi:hypothetical protein
MPSRAEPRRRVPAVIRVWNRRLHYFLGLYFLFFIWLFSLSGWLLNHPQWAASAGANSRAESRYDRALEGLTGDDIEARAREVMRQLDVVGEIGWPASQPANALLFNVNRPTEFNEIRVDLQTRVASVRHFENSGLAAFRIFHTFSGTRYTDAAGRDWLLTTVWVAAMDALAIGLLLMVFGGYHMWWQVRRKRLAGAVALAAGVVGCAIFLAGLF